VLGRATRSDISAVRRRLVYVLFSGAALAWLAFVATLTVATVAARSLSGSTILAGIPLAAGALGQALGTNVLGRVSTRYGRRFIMVVGPPVSACGAALELLGVVAGQYWMLVGGAILVGGGVGSIHLARYVAAELAEASEEGRAVGIVVWSGTVGSVVGANLVDWVGGLAQARLGTPYGGAFLLATVAFLLCWSIFWFGLRPDPSRVALTSGAPPDRGGSVSAALRLPSVQISILALLSAQGAMVLLMTATPLRIEDAGYGLDAVGLVLSVHAVGMFAFSPLVGRLVDRLGRVPMVGIGMGLTVVSLFLSGTAPYDGLFALATGLFVLGLGWSCSFIAASSMLFSSAPPDVRPVVEGWADSAVWTMVMAGSVGSGVLMGTVGYGWLSLTAALPMFLILLLALAVPRLRAAITA
jgi:MFS family permease